jgi:hypothetical protein
MVMFHSLNNCRWRQDTVAFDLSIYYIYTFGFTNVFKVKEDNMENWPQEQQTNLSRM